MEGINQRIKELIVSEGLTASIFADRIGVLRSALSHILAGRNKPGADFIEKLLLEMPYVNANWLFTGNGEMYVGKLRPEALAEAADPSKSPGRQLDILSQLAEMFPEEYGQTEEPKAQSAAEQLPLQAHNPAQPVSSVPAAAYAAAASSEKKVVKIILVYDDKTFSELKPE
ncbi:MAG: helix-turn-helix transcriptional regulator [Bacteroidia bacterium]|nr:helix-turn-helix transcriptional regulator [Bacteroidia bacterium]